jgi:MraZ protein
MQSNINIVGSYELALDAKGRINFPKSMREQLPAEERNLFVLSIGFEKNLKLYPKSVWDKMTAVFNKYSPLSKNVERLKLAFNAYADLIEVDAAGRISINKDLLAKADLKPGKTVRFVSIGDIIQIWDKEHFDAYQTSALDIGELSDEITGGNYLNPFEG